MELLLGKNLAEVIKEQIRADVALIKRQHGVCPKLCAVLVGDNPAAEIYTNVQKRAADSVGIDYELIKLGETISQDEIEQEMQELNQRANVSGIILQLPLPEGLHSGPVVEKMSPKKDVEGIHADNLGLLVLRKEKMPPCTAMAAVELLASTGINLYGAEVTIVGSSRIVGTPIALLMLEKLATTTVTNIATFETNNLEQHVRRADVLFVAVGKPNVIPGDWIKPGAIVIDIGINRVEGRIVGDVDFENAQKKASYITPVPGGVGPLTATILMRNVIQAFKWQNELKD